MPRLLLTVFVVTLLLAPSSARADEEPGPDAGHRFMIEFGPYTAWGQFKGTVDHARDDGRVDEIRGALGIGLQWEYAPIPYLGLGVKIDIHLPPEDPSYLMVLPTLALRGILPLAHNKMELFVMAQVGATYLQYGKDFVGYGWSAAGDLGIAYQVGRRWGAQFHAGYLYVTAANGDFDMTQPYCIRGFVGVYYRL